MSERCPDPNCPGVLVYVRYDTRRYCYGCGRREDALTPRERTRQAVEDVQRAVQGRAWSEAGRKSEVG